jgi:hypothetical protein
MSPEGLDIAAKRPGIRLSAAPRTRHGWRWAALVCLVSLSSACALNQKMTVIGTASLVQDVAAAASKQSDLRVVREGMPAYLLLMDGMVEGWPDNDRLLLASAQAYSSFASVVALDEKNPFGDVLVSRSKAYALRALAARGLPDPAGSPFEAFDASVRRMSRDDLPYAFWGGSCWAGWVAANINSIEAIADLPRIEALMRRSLALDESYYYGGPHLFMGIWYASRPPVAGGSLERAEEHFRRALEISQGKFLMTQVYFADVYCRKTMDRERFTATLQAVLEAPADAVPELTLLNTVAQRKARALLDQADDIF